MHYDTVMPEDSVQEEPVIETEVGNLSTPAPQKKRRKRKKVLKTLENYHFLNQMLN